MPRCRLNPYRKYILIKTHNGAWTLDMYEGAPSVQIIQSFGGENDEAVSKLIRRTTDKCNGMVEALHELRSNQKVAEFTLVVRLNTRKSFFMLIFRVQWLLGAGPGGPNVWVKIKNSSSP